MANPGTFISICSLTHALYLLNELNLKYDVSNYRSIATINTVKKLEHTDGLILLQKRTETLVVFPFHLIKL